MKQLALVLFFSLFFSVTYAQVAKDIFSHKTDITWLGMDFTQAKFFGKQENFGTEREMRKLILSWNELVLDEPNKYDVGRALDRLPLKNELQFTTEHNEKINLNELFDHPAGFRHLTRDEIAKVAASYDFKSLKGVGAMFVVESFSKTDIKGLIWVAFINLESKEVLFADRLSGDPVGFGVRNYWAKVIFESISELKMKYKNWSKTYSK